ncbi:hypothetical protein D3C80_1270430 [compost metagenome]
MAGDQNGFACHRTHVHRTWHRIAVSLSFAVIEDRHHVEVHFADAHGVVQQSIHVARLGAEPGHKGVVVGVDLVIGLAQYVGVLHIGRGAFQAVQAQHAQAVYIVADLGFIGIEGKLRGLL